MVREQLEEPQKEYPRVRLRKRQQPLRSPQPVEGLLKHSTHVATVTVLASLWPARGVEPGAWKNPAARGPCIVSHYFFTGLCHAVRIPQRAKRYHYAQISGGIERAQPEHPRRRECSRAIERGNTLDDTIVTSCNRPHFLACIILQTGICFSYRQGGGANTETWPFQKMD